MFKQYRLRDYRFRLVFYVYAISIIGVMVIGSARKSVQSQQIVGLALGTAAMLVVSLMDYTWVLKFYWLIYVFNLVLLSLVQIPFVNIRPFGVWRNGAYRWLNIGGFQFQPSELAKLLIILFFARFFEKYREHLNTWKILALTAVLFGIPVLYIKEQPDLSTTISIIVIFLVLIFIAGLSYKIIGAAVAVGVPSVIVFISLILQPDQKILDDYAFRRIMAWLEPAGKIRERRISAAEFHYGYRFRTAGGKGSEQQFRVLRKERKLYRGASDGLYLCGDGRGAWIYRLCNNYFTIGVNCVRMYLDRKAVQGILRNHYLLWGGRLYRVSELCQYLRGYGNYA